MDLFLGDLSNIFLSTSAVNLAEPWNPGSFEKQNFLHSLKGKIIEWIDYELPQKPMKMAGFINVLDTVHVMDTDQELVARSAVKYFSTCS